MKVLISGSTGLIGSALITLLTDAGHDVIRLVRSSSESGWIGSPLGPGIGAY